MLFDDELPTTPRPARAEGVFDFLARAKGSHWAAVRDALSTWFARYPADERETLRKRLFDDVDDKAQAAFWELLLHALYTAADFRGEVHPTLEDSEHRPDFRVSDDESAFLLEARVVTATSAEQRARNRRLQTLIDAITGHVRTTSTSSSRSFLKDSVSPRSVRSSMHSCRGSRS